MLSLTPTEDKDLRIIKTARNEAAINEAARQGYFPLVKPVVASDEVRTKFAVRQNKHTGEVHIIGDLRDGGCGKDYDMVIPFTWYYQYHFESPFAAYLVPSDIEVGDHVYLEDLIEDVPIMVWNQGDTARLGGCIAIWNGNDFEIQLDVNELPAPIVG